MEDFQLVLSILGAIAIIAVLVHGFWSIRRQHPKTLKDNPMTGFYKEQSDKRDSQGFDADGIGEVRRVKSDEHDHEATVADSNLNTYAQTDINKTTDFNDVDDVEITEAGSKKGIGLQNPSATNSRAPSYHPGRKEPVMKVAKPEVELEHVPTQQALFTEDFVDDSPQIAPISEPLVNTAHSYTHETASQQGGYQQSSLQQTSQEPDAHQPAPQAIEPTFAVTPEPVAEVVEPVIKDEPLGDPKDVLVLHVVARDGEQIHGAELLPCLLSLNFKFGDMDIFHRHSDNAGNGKVLFSMANMLKPGVFDPDNMEQFVTQGVVFFMTLPCHGDSLMNFSIMLNSAYQLADDLGAEVLDDKRLAWTDVNKQAYLSRIKAVS